MKLMRLIVLCTIFLSGCAGLQSHPNRSTGATYPLTYLDEMPVFLNRREMTEFACQTGRQLHCECLGRIETTDCECRCEIGIQ